MVAIQLAAFRPFLGLFFPLLAGVVLRDDCVLRCGVGAGPGARSALRQV